jgi:membrane-anchored protein YejM (alkaline phosphatase superfamily)
MEDYGASEEKSVIANAAVLPAMFLAKLTGRANKTEYSHAREYTNVMDRTRALIGNSQVNFVFLHLPVPHPPGIYDRQRHVLRSGGTYLDNLVLADDTLGTLLQEIDATPSASQTTVIISSDHSWRVPTWSRQEGWSSEEEKISGGHFDDRPVLLIHFPGQKQGSDVNTLLPELLEHDIIADMLLGKISNAEELADFIAPPGK